MVRTLVAGVLLVIAAQAASTRLYLKDGTYHNVREYEEKGDRVRFYSTERSDWEEIPLDLVDLQKTKDEAAALEKERSETAALADAEEKAERAQRREIARIPLETGVFRVNGEAVQVLKQAESKAASSKKRSILGAMSPIPVVAGKTSIEVDGLKSQTVISEPRPEFYIRLAAEERFAIVRATAGKNARIIQKWNIIPVTKEIIEETDIVETFKQQIADGLYKIWPTKPLTSGEYAVVEYTEGKGNIQIWDFSLAQP